MPRCTHQVLCASIARESALKDTNAGAKSDAVAEPRHDDTPCSTMANPSYTPRTTNTEVKEGKPEVGDTTANAERCAITSGAACTDAPAGLGCASLEPETALLRHYKRAVAETPRVWHDA